MDEYIAVMNPGVAVVNVTALFRTALLFDRVAVPLLPIIESCGQLLVPRNTMYTRPPLLRALEAAGIVFGAPMTANGFGEPPENMELRVPWFLEHAFRDTVFIPLLEVYDGSPAARRIVEEYYDIHARMSAAHLRIENGKSASAILRPDSLFLDDTQTEKGIVLRTVLERLPFPSPDLPWNALADFRADPEAGGMLVRLRRWMSDFARKQPSAVEVKEELDYLLHSYAEHMRHHRIKYELGAIELIATTAAEVIEDIVKVKLKDLAKIPFTVRKDEISLWEAELNAPGRDVAYILKVEREFSE